jgi:hypothetical protein
VLDRQDGQAQGDARDLLAPGKSSLLSADSLRELAKEAPISQPELAPATSSAPPLWHPTPPPLSAAQIPTDTGVRLRWSILMLLGIALIALGVAVGVMIVKLTS